MNYYHVLSNSAEEQVCKLAEKVLHNYSTSHIKVLSGPRAGLVMLQVRETVANSRFYTGEVLVTEVKLELDGQFGFGMVIGDSPRKAMAIALVDAAMRKNDAIAEQLINELQQLDNVLTSEYVRFQALAATTKVNFERM